MFYWTKPNEPHSVEVIEESTFLDVFSLPREEPLEKAMLKGLSDGQRMRI